MPFLRTSNFVTYFKVPIFPVAFILVIFSGALFSEYLLSRVGQVKRLRVHAMSVCACVCVVLSGGEAVEYVLEWGVVRLGRVGCVVSFVLFVVLKKLKDRSL